MVGRIRTIKPEFFTSPSTARASHTARLFYVALWCWADDYGRGETNLPMLAGFAFPEDDQITRKEVPSLCKEVADAFDVEFYTVHGRFYYSIPTWDEHQRTQRKAASRHPGPDHAEAAPDLRFSENQGTSARTQGTSAQTQGHSGTGTGEREQGKGEQGNSEPTVPGDASAAATEADETAQTIIADWLDTLSQRPPGRVIGHLSKEVKNLLDEGQDFEQVRAAVHEWNRRGLHPSTLPSVLHGLRNERPRLSAADRRRAASIDRHNRLSNYTPPMEDPFGNVITIEPQKEIAQ